MFRLILLAAVLAAPLSAVTIFGYKANNHLVSFDSATPGTVNDLGVVTGMQASEFLYGIDFRPANGLLYGLGSTGRLYTINTTTAAATQVGSNVLTLTATSHSIDFNPVADRLRTVADNDANFRVNPNDAMLASTDTAINPGTAQIVAVAYDRSFSNSIATTAFAIDSASNSLMMLGGVNGTPSSNGGIVSTIGPLGLTLMGSLQGLDIDPQSNIAYASFILTGAPTVAQFCTINLTTGAATTIGAVGGAGVCIDIAVQLLPNAAPITTAPVSVTTPQNVAYVFSGGAISVADADASTNPLLVTLTVTNGTLTLSGTAGLTFSAGDGSADTTMTFGGVQSALNASLSGMIFTPTAGFTGNATMTVGVSDLGAAGTGGVQTDSDSVPLVNVDAGYSHEFTTAQVHYFLEQEYGKNYAVKNPRKFAVFEDHLLYATGVKRFAPFEGKIQTLRDLQREFQKHTNVRDYSAKNGVSPGICHQVAREHFVDPGDFVQATDSHTCMGGGNNALSYGVGATEYAGLIYSGFTFVAVPQSIRFNLTGKLQAGVTAKDVMLHILDTYAKREQTLDRVMEFGGPGLKTISMDERATLCNMATECSAKSGICEADDVTWAWFKQTRKLTDAQLAKLKERSVSPDKDAKYDGGVHDINLSEIKPMIAEPGDPTYGKLIDKLGEVKIDIAYAGSCTAGKIDDLDYYATVLREAVDAGRQVAKGVKMYLQYGSEDVMAYAKSKGYPEVFAKAGVEVINPGCGACIGCGPGVSDTKEQVTVSAINRNFPGRSGPGKLYLASPLTVAASAVEGRIVSYKRGMFKRAQ